MAMILSFVPRRPAGSAAARPLADGGAVIIFPGVRYEPAPKREGLAIPPQEAAPGNSGGTPARH